MLPVTCNSKRRFGSSWQFLKNNKRNRQQHSVWVFLKNSVETGNPWYSIHFIMIRCNYSTLPVFRTPTPKFRLYEARQLSPWIFLLNSGKNSFGYYSSTSVIRSGFLPRWAKFGKNYPQLFKVIKSGDHPAENKIFSCRTQFISPENPVPFTFFKQFLEKFVVFITPS